MRRSSLTPFDSHAASKALGLSWFTLPEKKLSAVPWKREERVTRGVGSEEVRERGGGWEEGGREKERDAGRL
eukprot:1465194-Pleurochrysis_carterae.AAC.1